MPLLAIGSTRPRVDDDVEGLNTAVNSCNPRPKYIVIHVKGTPAKTGQRNENSFKYGWRNTKIVPYKTELNGDQ